MTDTMFFDTKMFRLRAEKRRSEGLWVHPAKAKVTGAQFETGGHRAGKGTKEKPNTYFVGPGSCA